VNFGDEVPSDADQPGAPTGEIGVFLHVATLGRYQEVADEVLLGVHKSGLFERASFIEVSVVGEAPFVSPVIHDKVRIVRRSRDVTVFEHPTLDAIQAYSRAHPEAHVLYLNCLGGRHVGPHYEIRAQWRRLLQFMLVERYDHCVAALRTYDVCGVDWRRLPLPHMTSNNWWAKAGYLAGLCTPAECADRLETVDLSAFGRQWSEPERKRRHSGEFWLGMNSEARGCSLFKLETAGFPPLQYGSVPWWGMPGINWERAARRQFSSRRSPDLGLLSKILVYQAKHRLRFLKPLMRPRAHGETI